jgi:hypothetical protein
MANGFGNGSYGSGRFGQWSYIDGAATISSAATMAVAGAIVKPASATITASATVTSAGTRIQQGAANPSIDCDSYSFSTSYQSWCCKHQLRVARSRLQASVLAWAAATITSSVQQSPLERLLSWLDRQLSRLLQPSLARQQRYMKAYRQSPAPARWWSQGQSNGLKNQRPQRPTVSNPLPQQIGQHNQTLQQTGARQLKG